METRVKTDKTAEAIRAAIENTMKNNRRNRVFVAVAERNGDSLIVGLQNDYPLYSGDFRGIQGIRRECWGVVPGYAERACSYLAGIMTGTPVKLNG